MLVLEQRGLVLQRHGLVSLLAAAENVTLPLQAPGRPRVARGGAEAGHGRARGGAPRRGRRHLVEALSGGQQQRVAVAQASITRPALLIADKQTAALDVDNRQHVADLLFALPASGTSLVLVTHDPTLAPRGTGSSASTARRPPTERVDPRPVRAVRGRASECSTLDGPRWWTTADPR